MLARNCSRIARILSRTAASPSSLRLQPVLAYAARTLSTSRTALVDATTAAKPAPAPSKTYLPPITVDGQTFVRDAWTNTPPSILSLLPRRLHMNPAHPIGILRHLLESYLPTYTHLSAPSPIVTVKQNFDDLGFPADHPGRSRGDSYYLDARTMLRTHTSAHEPEVFARGEDRWVLTADVYRRDEIDASHYPAFHQMEGAHVWDRSTIKDVLPAEIARLRAELDQAKLIIEDETLPNSPTNPYQAQHDPEIAALVADHLKATLSGLVYRLFSGLQRPGDEPLRVRWIEAYFPWTGPSFEVEVMYRGEWLELLGCGMMSQDALDRFGVPQKTGWAFGLGLERIAMVLFNIPDIRLFWSVDERFARQFAPGRVSTFEPYSRFPPCYKDISFWLPEQWHENDFFEVVREVARDSVEDVKLIDDFTHPKTARRSVCFRVNYRSMDRNLTNEEANELHAKVTDKLVRTLGIEPR